MDQRNRFRDRFQLVLFIDDDEFGDINLIAVAHDLDQIPVTDQGHLDKTHVRSKGSGFDGMGIYAPGGDHAFADFLFLQFLEQFVEIGNHMLILGYPVQGASCRGR